MKALTIILCLLICIQTTAQQLNEQDQIIVPDMVLGQFEEMYPQASKVEWSSTDSLYLVAFSEGDEILQTASFTLHGEWVETTSPVSLSSLPKKVVSGLAENYGDCELRHARCNQKPKKVVDYTTILKRGSKHLKVRVDEKGMIISSRELTSLD